MQQSLLRRIRRSASASGQPSVDFLEFRRCSVGVVAAHEGLGGVFQPLPALGVLQQGKNALRKRLGIAHRHSERRRGREFREQADSRSDRGDADGGGFQNRSSRALVQRGLDVIMGAAVESRNLLLRLEAVESRAPRRLGSAASRSMLPFSASSPTMSKCAP